MKNTRLIKFLTIFKYLSINLNSIVAFLSDTFDADVTDGSKLFTERYDFEAARKHSTFR